MKTLRIVDSGLRNARENLSLTEALCRGHRAGTTPNTFRFQHFPPSAIIGRHQLLHREVNLDWVKANGVATARRMTGGGAIVMGPGILGWELILSRKILPMNLGEISALICNGVAAGLGSFGLNATYRPRNDVEIEGRKISGTGGYFDGDTLVFQGTVLMALDLELLTHALHLPAHKLGKRGLESLSDRVGDLKRFLGTVPSVEAVEAALATHIGKALNLAPNPAALTDAEEASAHAIHTQDIGTDTFVSGLDDASPREGTIQRATHPTPGGVIDVAIKLRDGTANIVDQVMITGDFFATSPYVIANLEAHLRHHPAQHLPVLAHAFLGLHDARFLGISATDIATALAAALTSENA